MHESYRGQNLRARDFHEHEFRVSDLSVADFCGSNLSGCKFIGCYCHHTNFRDCDLSNTLWHESYIVGVDLSGSNVIGADFRKSTLRDVDLRDITVDKTMWPQRFLEHLLATKTILPQGDIIGWKKLKNGQVAKLLIRSHVPRVGGVLGRECRAAEVEVLEGCGFGIRDHKEFYEGKRVVADSFDPDPLVEYGHGIYFFITPEEAGDYH